jgi:hypothetical protein
METNTEMIKFLFAVILFIACIVSCILLGMLLHYLYSEIYDWFVLRRQHKYYKNQKPGETDFVISKNAAKWILPELERLSRKRIFDSTFDKTFN